MLIGVGTVQVNDIVDQVAGPYEIRVEFSGAPKESKVTLNAERTIVETPTLREGVKAAAVV